MAEKDLEGLFESVSGFFGLLAEPARLKILNALCDGERSVGEVVQRTESTQTSVSRHLNLMYAKGLLKRRRRGQQTLYAVADPAIVELCRTVCVHLASVADGNSVSSRTLRRFMPNREGR
jgi:DNA-binding transcriptional ArsR family regulator